MGCLGFHTEEHGICRQARSLVTMTDADDGDRDTALLTLRRLPVEPSWVEMLLTSDGTAQVAAARCTLRTDPTNPRLDPNINLSAAFGEFGRMAVACHILRTCAAILNQKSINTY